MRRKRWGGVVPLLIPALLAGCLAQQHPMTAPVGATPAQVAEDEATCSAAAQPSPGARVVGLLGLAANVAAIVLRGPITWFLPSPFPSGETYAACLRARGYWPDPSIPPPDDTLQSPGL